MSENQSLKEKTAKGLFWGGFSNGIQQLLNLLFGIFLARLLTPADYGMVGMLAIFSLIASSIQESGFTAALVNKKEVTHNDYNAVFWFNAAISLSLYLLLFLCAPLIADFYHTPELTPLARYSFIGFFIASLGISHSAYLLRNLMVKQRALSSVIGLTVSGITGVTLAYFGFSYWGIATQSIVYVAVNTACYWHFTRWQPSLQFKFTPIKEMFGFSGKLLVTNVFNHINNNLFSVILGKFYTEKEVGYYNQANKWCGMGQLFISGMINGVAQPVLTKVSDDLERQKRVFRKMLRFTAFVSFPAMLGVPINHLHIFTKLRYLRHSVIIKIITVDEQSVSLFHTHITEGLHRVGFLKNQRTITVHIHTVMPQFHVTNQHLHIRTRQLIRLTFISMKQINFGLFILRLLLVVRLFLIACRCFGFWSRLRRIRSRFN